MRTMCPSRVRTVLVVMVLLLLVLAGCGQQATATVVPTTAPAKTEATPAPTAAAEVVEVTWMNWISAESQSKVTADKMIAAFEKENPGIKIKSIPQGYEKFNPTLTTMIAGGNAPDTAQFVQQWTAQFASMGALEPLDSIIAKSILDDINYPSAKGGSYDGKLYSIVWSPGPMALIYNKKVMQRAGLDPSKPPTTFAEMMDMATTIGKVEGTPKVYGYGTHQLKDDTAGSWLMPLLWSLGGEFVDETGKIVLDSEASVAAMTELKGWYDTGERTWARGIDVRQVRELFAKDQIGFMIDGPWYVGQGRDLSGIGKEFDSHWGVVPVPPGKTGKSESLVWNHGLVMFKQSKHKEAAAKWLQFLVSSPAATQVYHDEQGMLAPNRSAWSDASYVQDPFTPGFLKQLETARAQPATNPNFTSAMVFIGGAQQEVLNGTKDPATALKEAAANIRVLYGQQ